MYLLSHKIYLDIKNTITMKYFIILLCTISSLCITAQDNQKITLGYTTGDLDNSIKMGPNMSLFIKGAIELPESMLEKYKGNYISEINLAVAEDLSEQYNFIFISKDLYSEPLYIQKVEYIGKGWNNIKLEEPVKIDGDKLYAGFQYKSSGEIISFDGEEDNNMANWLATYQTENESYAWLHQGGGAHNLQIVITGDQLPQNDTRLVSASFPKYVPLGESINTIIFVQNNGASDINSLDISLDFGNKGTVNKTINDLVIRNGETAKIPVSDIAFESPGITNCSITIDKVNNEEDIFPDDNVYTIKNIICKKDYVTRNVLAEQFSTENCMNCPNATRTINRTTRYIDNIIKIVHHSGFYTDELTIPQSEAYLFLYGHSPSTPAIMIDRKNFSQYGADNSDGPVFGIDNNLKNILTQEINTPAYISVNIDNKYDKESRQLSVQVYGEVPSEDISKLPGNDIRLNIFITEDSIKGLQMDIDGMIETYHMNSIRQTVTDTWGDYMDLSGFSYKSKEYTLEIPEEWNENNLAIIAFIANYNETDPNDCNILNGNSAKLDYGTESSVESAGENEYVVYDNDNKVIYFPEGYDSIVIYNIAGTAVYSGKEKSGNVNIENLDNGLYIVCMTKSQKTFTKKIIKR